jgi:hypothetical protein
VFRVLLLLLSTVVCSGYVVVVDVGVVGIVVVVVVVVVVVIVVVAVVGCCCFLCCLSLWVDHATMELMSVICMLRPLDGLQAGDSRPCGISSMQVARQMPCG